MTPLVPEGAATVGRAVRLLDRLGHVPSSLGGDGGTAPLTRPRLGGLLATGTGAAAVLEAALAAVPAGAPADPTAVPTQATRPHGIRAVPSRRGTRDASDVVLRPDRRAALPPGIARREGAGLPPAFDGGGRGETASVLRSPTTEPDAASAAAGVGPMPLSGPARLGAATRVARPARPGETGVAPSAAAPPPAPRRPAPAVRGAGAPAGPDRLAHEPELAAAAYPATASAPAARPAGDGPPAGRSRSAGDAPARRDDLAPAPGGLSGLAGLVDWWDAREADGTSSAVPHGPGRPATPPSLSAARSAGAADGGLPSARQDGEASPGRAGLRDALEEILVAEARAAGIEVHPW